MKVLGLVGSYRRLGNSEILVKEALMGAEREGADAEILRLTNYDIQPCRGDAICVFRGQRCHIQDDLNYVLDKMFESDGIILGTPTYIFESTAIIKHFIDRLLSVGTHTPLRGKPAAIIATYGVRGFTPFSFVQPNIWLLWLGMEVIHRALVLVQGVSEIVLDAKSLNRAHNIGRDVAMAIKTGDITYRGEEGICPICHDRNIRILKDMETVECGVCGIRGKISLEENKIKVDFKEEDIQRKRWTELYLYRHFVYHIVPSKDYFLRTKGSTKEKKKKYEEYLKVERD